MQTTIWTVEHNYSNMINIVFIAEVAETKNLEHCPDQTAKLSFSIMLSQILK